MVTIKKISPKEIAPLVTPPVDLETLGNTRPVPPRELYHLYCRINRTKQGHSTFGDWVKFIGEFRAVDPSTGAIIATSPAAHIPGIFSDMIYTKLDEARAADPRAFVEIALKVSIVPSDPKKPSARGYEWDVQSLLPLATPQNDPLTLMMQKVKELQALPAPAAEKKK